MSGGHSESYVDSEGEERCTTCDKWLEPGYYSIEDHRRSEAAGGDLTQFQCRAPGPFDCLGCGSGQDVYPCRWPVDGTTHPEEHSTNE